MRLSELFFTTLRDDPGEAEMPSHRLLLRAGYLRQLGSGIYSLLPLGKLIIKCHVKDYKLTSDGHGGSWPTLREGSVGLRKAPFARSERPARRICPPRI